MWHVIARGGQRKLQPNDENVKQIGDRTDMSSVCHTCNGEEPPLVEDDNDKDDQHMNGYTCDSCAECHHYYCLCGD